MPQRMRKVGGDLTMSSVVGAGTTVRIAMPQAGPGGQR
jgi:signal transduction histidine kinase